MSKFIIFFAVLTAQLLIGCSSAPETHNHSANNENRAPKTPTTTFGGAYRVEFATEPAQVKAGEPASLIFTVKNEQGEIFRDLEVIHEKPMHLIIVSEDLANFYHEHPEPQEDGRLKVKFAFPNGGNYRLYADFKPQGASQTVQNFPLRVDGTENSRQEIKPDDKLEKTVEGLKFTLRPEAEFTSGDETLLNFTVHDAASGEKINDLENYLGEKAHIVIISQDLKEYVHAHQMSMDGARETHPHDSNTEHAEKLMNNQSDSAVSAHVAFPKPGLYKIWAQFQRRGKIITVPFVVSVKEGREEKSALDNIKIPDGAIKVVVSRDGFIPQEITFKKDKSKKIAFIRTDAENCGDEIVFKELDIRRKLPVGEVVTIDIPEGQRSEINFACGTNNFEGKIIVQ